MGITSAPNVELRDWKTIEVSGETRPAYYHWLHVRCVNRQRTGWSSLWGSLPTRAASSCYAVVEFRRMGGDVVQWDYVPFEGHVTATDTRDLLVNDRRVFLPLFLELDHDIPDPRNQSAWLPPGVYPTGQEFFRGVTKRLPEGKYFVTVVLKHGGDEILRDMWDGSIIVGADGCPVGRATSQRFRAHTNGPLNLVMRTYQLGLNWRGSFCLPG